MLLGDGTTKVEKNYFTLYITFGVSLEEHLFPLLFVLCPTENRIYLKIAFSIWIRERQLKGQGFIDLIEFFGSDRGQV